MPDPTMLERTLTVPVDSPALSDRATRLGSVFLYMQEAFVDLDELIEEYVRSVPWPAEDATTTDAERFFGWLCTHYGLTEEQMDVVNGERARGAVQRLVEERHDEHELFQYQWQRSASLANAWCDRRRVQLHVNPITVGATYQTTTLLDEDVGVPARVLFFPVGDEVRSTILDPTGRAIVRYLAETGARTLDELRTGLTRLDRKALVTVPKRLVRDGLAAFA